MTNTENGLISKFKNKDSARLEKNRFCMPQR
jgi:hypothetical protein